MPSIVENFETPYHRSGELKSPSSTARNNFLEENAAMNARKPIRDAIIRKKFWHWKAVALNRSVYGSCPPSQARKNFWRLCARYPEIAAKLGLDEASVY
jgi:hypothetical protein